jgi:hypothetical protein
VLRQPSRVRATLCALFVAVCSLPTAAAEIQKPDPPKADAPKTSVSVPSSPPAGSQNLSRIFASWKTRQERVKSFHFSWDSKIAWPKDYAFRRYQDNPVVGGWKVRGDLTGDQSVEFTIPQSEFWVEGKDRVRDEFFEVEFTGPKDWKRTARICNVVGGTTISRLTMPVVADESPELSIWGQPSLKDLAAFSWQPNLLWPPRSDPRVVDWAPLRLAFRPFDPALGWSSIEHCRVVGEDVLGNDLRCVKVRMDARDLSEMCWVDPSRDNVIVRWEKRKARSGPVSVAIEYRRDKEHGWIPSRWVHQLPGTDPEISGSVESTVTHYTINEKFPVDTFQRSAPSGTRVCDVTTEGLTRADTDPKSESARPPGSAIPSLDAIVAAWKNRQKKTKSLKFTWREERANWRGSATQESHTVLIDGDRFAYVEDNNPYPPDMASLVIAREQDANAPQKWPRPQRQLPNLRPARAAFDGKSTRTYRGLPDSKITGIGWIGVGFHIREAAGFALEPVLLAFRPFDANLGRINLSDFRISPNRGKIGDVPCVILEATDAASRIETFYWLDPARDYIVLRKQQTTNATDSARMDISYRRDPAAGWIPDGCRQSAVSVLGKRWRSETSTITAFTVNQPIPAAEFLVEFPKGTRVHDLPKQVATGSSLRIGPGVLRLGRGPRPPREPDPDPIFKPLFDPFADSVADIQAAIKTAKARKKRVLVVFGDNSFPDSLNLCNILIGNAEVSPLIKNGFVLVLVDLYTDAGGLAEETFFDVPHRITLPHVGVLDSTGELLQFQIIDWLCSEEGNRGYDLNRIKRLLGYWVK